MGEVSNKHDGETLEILARDIGIGRESLRKLDVIKQTARWSRWSFASTEI